MIFKRLIVFCILSLFTTFIGCTEKSSEPDNNNPVLKMDSVLIGTWDLNLLAYSQVSSSPDTILAQYAGVYGTLQLYREGDFSYQLTEGDSSYYYDGKWTAENGKLSLKDSKGKVIEMNYSLYHNREWDLPRDTVTCSFQGKYEGNPANIKYFFRRIFVPTKDQALSGKWYFQYMDILQNNQTEKITNSDIYINYSLDFQSSWFVLDSIISGLTVKFTDDNWEIIDNKIFIANDYGRKVWKYQVSTDTLTIRFKGLHEDKEAIFTQKFKKILD